MEKSEEVSRFVTEMLNDFLDKKFGGKKYDYRVQEATKKGDNYMGVVYRIVVKFPDDPEVTFNLILKVPPQSMLRRKQFFARAGFLRESLAYDEFLPLIKSFQNSKGVSDNQKFDEYPKCYFTMTRELHEAICMEDLNDAGFYMHDRFKPLTCDQVALIMRIYGKLHATSLAIKDQIPEKLTTFKAIVDVFVQRKDDPQLNYYFESLKISALDSLDLNNEEIYWSTLNDYFNKGTFYDLMLNLLDSRTSEPYAVICHGDCWINNIMFKNKNGKIQNARLIDWQIMRYSSPVIDLMYFIMSCTTKEFRDQYFKEMLDIYYSSAAEHLRRLGSEPEMVYPRSGLDRELKQKGSIGLLFAMIVLPILATKSEDVPDLEELSKKVSAGQSTDAMGAGFVGAKSTIFNERIRGIIRDSVDWGLI